MKRNAIARAALDPRRPLSCGDVPEHGRSRRQRLDAVDDDGAAERGADRVLHVARVGRHRICNSTGRTVPAGIVTSRYSAVDRPRPSSTAASAGRGVSADRMASAGLTSAAGFTSSSAVTSSLHARDLRAGYRLLLTIAHFDNDLIRLHLDETPR